MAIRRVRAAAIIQHFALGVRMHIELDHEDVVLLRRLLERVLGDLRMEISNTENFEWRQSLHADETRLKAVLERLERLA
jgi:hypothetical protein